VLARECAALGVASTGAFADGEGDGEGETVGDGDGNADCGVATGTGLLAVCGAAAAFCV